MTRILGISVAVAILAVFALPFGKEAYHRYQVSQRLDTVMDDRDRQAFSQWNGDAASFGRSLFERCEREQGAGAGACERYRFAFQ
ncbi:MAG TPA: hypothetical protein VHW66_08890 [Stellaceae bacterium]|jgi:hypothetical protein|nr:hypothetical protein [Stellaceae bacterium]